MLQAHHILQRLEDRVTLAALTVQQGPEVQAGQVVPPDLVVPVVQAVPPGPPNHQLQNLNMEYTSLENLTARINH